MAMERKRPRAFVVLSAAALSTAVAATAASSAGAASQPGAPVPPQPPAASPPSPPAAPASVTVRFRSFLRARRKLVGVAGVPVRITGAVSPYVSGQTVTVRVYRRSKQVLSRSLAVGESGGLGRFATRFRPRRRGSFTVRATLVAAAPGAVSSRPARRLLVVTPRAGHGSRGPGVRALQRRLRDLGYVTRVNGFYGGDTGRAVLALRKVLGASRAAVASAKIFRRLARGGGRYRVRRPKGGRHVEFDWSRQVLVLAKGARPVKIIHASSGKASTPTVFGHYRFYSKTAGYNSRGMYYSNYFIGGYAIHGYASVPTYPASHGCIRIPIASARSVYAAIRLGDDVYVYR